MQFLSCRFFDARLPMFFALVFLGFPSQRAVAQACDPSTAPDNLTSVLVSGSGLTMSWDPIPGSVAARLRVDLPGGSTFNRIILGAEPDQFFVPESFLLPGTYTWRVQASCDLIPPYQTTPVSATATFTIPADPGSCPVTVTDINGNVYNNVLIGTQCWMAENLVTTKYRNGSNLATGLSEAVWSSTTTGAYAVYEDSAINRATYGNLYNWFAVDDPRGLCPLGWHVPTDADWNSLMTNLGGFPIAGGKLKSVGTLAAGTGLWASPNIGATNSSGFTAHPSGYRDDNGVYGDKSFYTAWWSSNENSLFQSSSFGIYYIYGDVFNFSDGKRYGLPVRCVKD